MDCRKLVGHVVAEQSTTHITTITNKHSSVTDSYTSKRRIVKRIRAHVIASSNIVTINRSRSALILNVYVTICFDTVFHVFVVISRTKT